MKDFKQYFEEIKEDLKDCEEEFEKIEMLMEYGEELEEFDKEDMIDENKVKGCVSLTYISAYKDSKGKIQYKGYSDALMVKGFVGILVNGLSDLDPKTIIEKTPEVIEKFVIDTNIKASVTPSRANSFGGIYELMIEHAKRLM